MVIAFSFFGLESLGAFGYLLALFLYAVAAAVALPTPVELLLFFYPEVSLVAKALVLGLGKGVGAIAVFYVGKGVNPWIERWMTRHAFWRRFLKVLETFVRRTREFGLAFLLAIPFMSDTAVNYLYALLNEEGRAVSRLHFVLANVIGGIARGLIVVALLPG
ncbi:MAG TPA: hypothetical protein VIB49_06560 [Thermoplasmata archaeon]|jgi:uncharacterized membrane protein YdjX (TVP38/TMEM64 family)